MTRAHDELIDFIAGGPSSADVARYTASDGTKERVAELIRREKTVGLSTEERGELDDYLRLEHLLRLIKKRAASAVTFK